MRRKPAVNTATSLIKRKETAEFKALLQRIQQAFPKLFQQTRLDPPRCGKKKKSRYGNKDIRSERNQQLKDKYQIYNEWRDRHFYLSTRISQLYGVMFCNCLIIDQTVMKELPSFLVFT